MDLRDSNLEKRAIVSFFAGSLVDGYHGGFSTMSTVTNPAIMSQLWDEVDQKYREKKLDCISLFQSLLNVATVPGCVATYDKERKVVVVDTTQPLSPDIEAAALESGYYNTAVSHKGLKLFCPIACSDCEMALQCSVMSEEKRCMYATPKEISKVQDDLLFF
jgi:hypothetical protein